MSSTQIAEAFVAIRPQVQQSDFKGAITKAAVPAATKAGEETGKAFGAGMKSEVSVVRGLSILAAGAGAGVFLRGAKQQIEESIVAGAQLSAVLKSTGAAAGVSEEHANKLADALQAQDAIDNDLIKHNEALLLSFRHVANQMGAGNDVFDRAIKDAADLSALFGGDMQGATLQLGKALENPLSGITALQRAGVTFTAAQKDQIKTLVESNDLLGAQKIILDEVEKQFGGTAAAIAAKDPFKQFDVSIKNFQESVGRDLLPTLSIVFKVAEDLFSVFGAIPKPVRELGAGLAVLAVGAIAVTKVTTALAGLKDAFFATTVAEEGLTVATIGLGQAFAGLAVGVGAGIIAGNKINEVLAGNVPKTDEYAKSLENLGKSGEITGTALNELGPHAEKLRGAAETIQGSTLQKGFGLAPSAHEAVSDIQSVNDALIQILNTSGRDAAMKAFSRLMAELGPITAATGAEFHPFLSALEDTDPKAAGAAGGIDTVTESLKNLFTETLKGRSSQLALDDAISSVTDAQKDLNDTKAEALGQGPKSIAAAEAEAQAAQGVVDANKGVVDAQRGVADAMRSAEDASRGLADAQRGLAEAQQALAEFDSPVSQTIRTLQRQQITERVVTAPEDVRQKQIDLLTFDQQAADQRQSLQAKIADATRGVAAANRSVADAMRGVVDAQGKVRDASDKVRDAENKVAVAAAARRKVMVDAATEINGKERKLEESILAAGTALATFAEDAQPGADVLKLYLTYLDDMAVTLDPSGVLSKNLDLIKGKLDVLATDPNSFGTGPGGETTLADSARLQMEANPNYPASKISVADKAALEFLGLRHFQFGGIVPGPAGAPLLAIVHGGERVQTKAQQQADLAPVTIHQTNNYIDSQRSAADVKYSARELGWMVRRKGRRA